MYPYPAQAGNSAPAAAVTSAVGIEAAVAGVAAFPASLARLPGGDRAALAAVRDKQDNPEVQEVQVGQTGQAAAAVALVVAFAPPAAHGHIASHCRLVVVAVAPAVPAEAKVVAVLRYSHARSATRILYCYPLPVSCIRHQISHMWPHITIYHLSCIAASTRLTTSCIALSYKQCSNRYDDDNAHDRVIAPLQRVRV